MAKNLLILIIFLAAFGSAPAQSLFADTVYTEIGSKAAIPVKSAGPLEKNLIIGGKFELSGPTVFYPEGITNLAQGAEVVDMALTRENDSVWNFRFHINGAGNIKGGLFQIRGEMLAGLDTVCSFHFFEININGAPADDFYGLAAAPGYPVPYPYYRFSKILAAGPNPVSKKGELYIKISIDRPSVAKIKLYGIRGKARLIRNLGYVGSGIYDLIYYPESVISPGLYLVALESNFGYDYKYILINE